MRVLAAVFISFLVHFSPSPFHHGLGFLEPSKDSNLGTKVFYCLQFIVNICLVLKLLYIYV